MESGEWRGGGERRFITVHPVWMEEASAILAAHQRPCQETFSLEQIPASGQWTRCPTTPGGVTIGAGIAS